MIITIKDNNNNRSFASASNVTLPFPPPAKLQRSTYKF